MNWLDTQTQELLQGIPPDRMAPTKTAEFGLVLLQKGPDQPRLVRAISRITEDDDVAAAALADRPLPCTIHPDLSHAEALMGQFELVCCDSTAAFFSADVLENGDKAYLTSLFHRVCRSPEFKVCRVTLHRVPKTEAGLTFADQFLGIDEARLRDLVYSAHLEVPFKKARIMKHWAQRVGVLLEVEPMPS